MIGYIIAAIIGGMASIFLYAIVSAGRINEEHSEAYWKGFTDGVQAQRKVETIIATASIGSSWETETTVFSGAFWEVENTPQTGQTGPPKV